MRQIRNFGFVLLLFSVSFAYGQVSSDTAPLKSAIVLPPGHNLLSETYKLYEDTPSASPLDAETAMRQHVKFLTLLKENNIRVLNILDLLQNAVSNAKKAGKWEEALSEIFPEQFSQLKTRLDDVAPEALLGRSTKFLYDRNKEGFFNWLIPVSSGFFYTRDFAVSTPKGILLTGSRVLYRKYENPIGLFLFRFADDLKQHSIVFDAYAEGVRCEGGDIIVKDEKTLLMGVDNLSGRYAARKIAAKLNMDVLGVSMPASGEFSGVNIEILHLDTVFNIVDKKKVLAVPYLFLKQYQDSNPIVQFLQGIETRPKEKGAKITSLQKAIKAIPTVGWLTRFQAGTGEPTDLNMKLGDYLLEQGYEIIPVGGMQGDLNQDQYVNERVLYELSLQAANVLQLAPGKVLAYAHNKHTNAELAKRGIEVVTFDGNGLIAMLGGPHCLAMPLARE